MLHTGETLLFSVSVSLCLADKLKPPLSSPFSILKTAPHWGGESRGCCAPLFDLTGRICPRAAGGRQMTKIMNDGSFRGNPRRTHLTEPLLAGVEREREREFGSGEKERNYSVTATPSSSCHSSVHRYVPFLPPSLPSPL